MCRPTLNEIQKQETELRAEIQRLVNEDVGAVLAGNPISNSERITLLAQDLDILHAAEDRLRTAAKI